MYVANSEPTIWQRGGGRAGVGERGLISGEPNRSEVGRDMGEVVRLTQGSPPDLTLKAVRDVRKADRLGDPEAVRGQRVADPRVVLMTQGL